MPDSGFYVLQAGRACIQDSGRQGWQRYGVPARGSSDSYAYRMGNALVGNPSGRSVVELTAFDLFVRTERDLLLAVTGAECDVTVDGHLVPGWQPIAVRAGSVVGVSHVREGLRAYLCCNGTINAPMLMGSVSPEPCLDFGWYLRAGQSIALHSNFTYFDHAYLRHPVLRPRVPTRRYRSPATIDVMPGPDRDQFRSGLATLTSTQYLVGPQSDEIGLQLVGTAPERLTSEEQLSRGVGVGAIEITPSGNLIALLRGRMLTAGYPVVAVATTAALSRLGQLQPGDMLGFRLVSSEEAIRTARTEQLAIDEVAMAVYEIGLTLQLPALHPSPRLPSDPAVRPPL